MKAEDITQTCGTEKRTLLPIKKDNNQGLHSRVKKMLLSEKIFESVLTSLLSNRSGHGAISSSLSLRNRTYTPVLLFLFLVLPCSSTVVTITGDVTKPSSIIPNAFSTITVWDPQGLSSPPPPNLSSNYPYLTHVELFTATGGCYLGFNGCTSDRDLFNNPSIGMASGVNASRLFTPLRNILNAGLTPHIVTGNVPIALSGVNARLGGFGFNSAPPANFSEYSDYLEAVSSQLADEFSLQVVKTWRWGVFTEFNNQDWLNGSSLVFQDLYDYSVCGLERGLGGAANVDVGVHACQQCGGASDWNVNLFLNHASTGVSACTGLPVHLNWTGNSFYEHSPGDTGDLSWFIPQGLSVLNEARTLGLPTLRFGIDEGRLLWGPEGPAFALTTRAVGDSYQGSWDALLFKLLTNTGVPDAYYARWGINSGNDGLFSQGSGVIDNVASNLAKLAFMMNGSSFIPTTNVSQLESNTGRMSTSPPSIVDAVVGVSKSEGVLRVLVFHHYPTLNVSEVSTMTASVVLCGINSNVPLGPVSGSTVTRIDDEHAQFWPAWREDVIKANISRAGGDYNSGWSEFSDQMPLASERAIKLLSDNSPRYMQLAELNKESFGEVVVGADYCLRFMIDLVPHGVALVEVSGVV